MAGIPSTNDVVARPAIHRERTSAARPCGPGAPAAAAGAGAHPGAEGTDPAGDRVSLRGGRVPRSASTSAPIAASPAVAGLGNVIISVGASTSPAAPPITYAQPRRRPASIVPMRIAVAVAPSSAAPAARNSHAAATGERATPASASSNPTLHDAPAPASSTVASAAITSEASAGPARSPRTRSVAMNDMATNNGTLKTVTAATTLITVGPPSHGSTPAVLCRIAGTTT
ncbi:hypothetical protein [Microbacterium aurum]